MGSPYSIGEDFTYRGNMINKNIKILEKYCSDYKNIENYEEALTSPLRYDLHHRREISENKSRKQLIAENLYYGRPPEELIFLEHGEHQRLHKEGKNLSAETKNRMSEAKKGHLVSEDTRKKMSDAKKGEKCYMYGKHPSAETRQKISEAQKGEKSYMFGKNLSAETRQKMSDALRGKHWHLENGHRIWTD